MEGTESIRLCSHLDSGSLKSRSVIHRMAGLRDKDSRMWTFTVRAVVIRAQQSFGSPWLGVAGLPNRVVEEPAGFSCLFGLFV